MRPLSQSYPPPRYRRPVSTTRASRSRPADGSHPAMRCGSYQPPAPIRPAPSRSTRGAAAEAGRVDHPAGRGEPARAGGRAAGRAGADHHADDQSERSRRCWPGRASTRWSAASSSAGPRSRSAAWIDPTDTASSPPRAARCSARISPGIESPSRDAACSAARLHRRRTTRAGSGRAAAGRPSAR